MKKIIVTILIMLQLFYVGMINAKVESFDNGYGKTIVYVEIFGFRFNYWNESEEI